MTLRSGLRRRKFVSLAECLPVVFGAAVLASLGACGGDAASQSPPAVAPADPTASADACELLTPDEIATATHWRKPTTHAADTGATFVTSCTFTDGDDLASVVTVTVSTGGPTHKNASEFAQSVGDNGGMLTERATAVDGFPVPVIAMEVVGGMHGMQARAPSAVELTVLTGSMETTRELFPKALTRLLAKGSDRSE